MADGRRGGGSAPVRYLAEGDDLLLSHADRTRILEPHEVFLTRHPPEETE